MHSHMHPPLVEFHRVSVILNRRTILREITWQLFPGEHWAVLGGNGAGKSTFFKLVRGELAPAPDSVGRRTYHLEGDSQTTALGLRDKIALVSPELQERYLQQEWRLTAEQVIQTGFFGTDLLYEPVSASQRYRARQLARQLGAESILRRNVQTLSAGELRKILIARALAGAPRVLVCDEVCDGLDADARGQMLSTLNQLTQNGPQLLYTTHRPDELISAVTHVLELEAGRVVRQGPRLVRQSAATGSFGVSKVESGGETPPQPVGGDACVTARSRKPRRFEFLIRVRNASVFVGRKKVLQRIHWCLRPGEHWAVSGRNGAGKSTFLKLVAGALHPAAGGEVQRFDLTERDTIWDLHRKVGYVSPELQANYRETVTGAQVIASGFFASVGLLDPLTSTQRRRVRTLTEQFQIEALADRRVGELSYGEFRRLLLARALVHSPELLLFDEPFDGLDVSARVSMRATLDSIASAGTSLVLVTHHPEEWPDCITHELVLAAGRIVQQGCRKA